MRLHYSESKPLQCVARFDGLPSGTGNLLSRSRTNLLGEELHTPPEVQEESCYDVLPSNKAEHDFFLTWEGLNSDLDSCSVEDCQAIPFPHQVEALSNLDSESLLFPYVGPSKLEPLYG